MQRPIYKPIGTALEALDTPSLVVDLAALQHNIETVHGFFRDREAKIRPHVEAHRCPAIAARQLAALGTVGGVSVNTLGQAEVFAATGCSDILVANQVVTPAKIERLCALAHQVRMTVAVDSAANVAALSAAASAHAVTLGVLVDVDTGANRCGVAPGDAALALARSVTSSAGLEFEGLMTYVGEPLDDRQSNVERSRQRVQKVLDTRDAIERAGLTVLVLSAGATHDYRSVGAMAGVTEVRAGSYALMDGRHRAYCPELQPAARIMATVISRPESTMAITDAGVKATGLDAGDPTLERIAGVDAAVSAHTTAGFAGAEHGLLELQGVAEAAVAVGDLVWTIPADIGTCANLHDYVYLVSNGRLAAVWPVGARGQYR